MNNTSKFLLPVLGCVLLAAAHAAPVFVLDTGFGTYDVTIKETSFAADSANLEAMPWWQNVNLTYALSSTLYGQFGYNGDNLAVFAVGPASNYGSFNDLNGNPVADLGTAITVNTNNPSIGYPYFADVTPDTVLPYVETVPATVPDNSSSLMLCAAGAVALVGIGRKHRLGRARQ